MEIAAGVDFAGGTITDRINRIFIQVEFRLTNINTLGFGFTVVQETTSGQSGGSHAVKHIRSGPDN